MSSYDTTGKGLSNTTLESLIKFSVELKFICGQGYDGTTAISGNNDGVLFHIWHIYPSAIHVHCFVYILNFANRNISKKYYKRDKLF